MAYWGFSYNIPLIVNNFLYLILILLLIVGVVVGVYAARHLKALEKTQPVNEAYQEQLKARQEHKAAKKALKEKAKKN